MTAGLTADQVRGKLRSLGARRMSLAAASANLARETHDALVEARGHVTTVEAAALAGVARSTAYKLLGPDERGDGDGDGVRGSGPTT